MAAKKTGADAPEGSGQKPEDGGQRSEEGGQKPEGEGQPTPRPEGGEAVKGAPLDNGGPTAEEMFGRFMVAVAGRPLSVHQPVKEIGDTAERLTAEWLARKDNLATKQRRSGK